MNANPASENKPPPKPRLAPKRGLQAMILFITDLRLRARMSDGKDADGAWLRLDPEDCEALEDLADELEKLRLGRAAERRSTRR